MTDAGGVVLGVGERVTLTVLLTVIAFLVGADALSDLSGGGSSAHVSIELAVATMAAAAVGVLWTRYVLTRTALDATRDTLGRTRADAESWRRRNEATLRGLADAIDQQLDAWRLTRERGGPSPLEGAVVQGDRPGA
jgi:hypothetical protein